MKIAFISNFYNHHQVFLSRQIYTLTDGQFKFIETSKMPEERRNLKYSNFKDEFVIFYYDSVEKNQEWIDSADIVIMGSAPKKLVANRKKQNKVIFRYNERPLKNGMELWKYPVRWLRWHISNPSRKRIYLLCASGYTASDYKKFGMFKVSSSFITASWKYLSVLRLLFSKYP